MTAVGCSTTNWYTIEINVAVEKLHNRVSMLEEVIRVVQRNMAFMVGREKGFIVIYSGTIDGAREAFLNGVHSILMEDCKSLDAGVNKLARVYIAQEMFDEMPHELSDSQAIIKFSSLRYWNYNVVSYHEKVMDGFYDVYGITSKLDTQGKMPLSVDLQAISISDNVDYEVIFVNRLVDHELQKLEKIACTVSKEYRVSKQGQILSGLIQKIATTIREYSSNYSTSSSKPIFPSRDGLQGVLSMAGLPKLHQFADAFAKSIPFSNPRTRPLHTSHAKLHQSRDEVYEVLSTLLVIYGGGKIFLGLQVLGEKKCAPQLLDFSLLNVVFKPFDKGSEHGFNIRDLFDVGDGVKYFHVKVAGLLIVATIRVNVSSSLALELLQGIACVIKDYLRTCNIWSKKAV
ncbi:uncharacterized protein LOC121264796 [Juglans microcarpa x Juglans regia]|uniref:uncharacterized protein LOC121264796 n=1 Tax=Juglans microcarpa x Juglans regia TaxID=2249226 RepID=UPI001B7E8D31|nr:uncharacterized protein LOC121264796 [Juglans microcarpa x Juglans regia]